MRLIDADALKEYTTGGVTSVGLLTLAEIDEAPTVDAVPVVRCNDCRKWEYDENFSGWCTEWRRRRTLGNHFCSYGERRSE